MVGFIMMALWFHISHRCRWLFMKQAYEVWSQVVFISMHARTNIASYIVVLLIFDLSEENDHNAHVNKLGGYWLDDHWDKQSELLLDCRVNKHNIHSDHILKKENRHGTDLIHHLKITSWRKQTRIRSSTR